MKPRILCVDDQAENLLIREMFLEQFGYEVIAVTEPQDCLAAVLRDAPDLVLMDYHLGGGVKGDKLAQHIRSVNPHIRLIMLTGDPRIPEAARDSVDTVIIKGLSSPSDLLDAINRLLPAGLRPAPRSVTRHKPTRRSGSG